MVRNNTLIAVRFVLVKCRNSIILQIIDTLAKGWLMLKRCRIFEVHDAKILSEADIENSVSILSNIEVICVEHFHIDIIARFIKQMEEVLNCC